MSTAAPTGVLLINLGTPDSPTPRDVRRYLREFLGDPRVLDMPALARWLLLNLVILPRRPRQSAAQYASIWTEAGSPLLVESTAVRDRTARALGNEFVVELGMRYGNPSIGSALEALAGAGARRVLVLPQFPQYSDAATGSAIAKTKELHAARPRGLSLEFVEDFYDDPGFIAAWAAVVRSELDAATPDHVLFSYHGLPERQIRKLDASGDHCFAKETCCDAVGDTNRRCYRAQCYATTRAIAGALDLAPDRFSTSFQSRLGRTPWIRPYTDHVLPELAASGVRRLAVLCPAFTADCLETVEEIGIRADTQWRELGGESLKRIPCLNHHPVWIETLAGWARSFQSKDRERAASMNA